MAVVGEVGEKVGWGEWRMALWTISQGLPLRREKLGLDLSNPLCLFFKET